MSIMVLTIIPSCEIISNKDVMILIYVLYETIMEGVYMVYNSLNELVGSTPLLRLRQIEAETGANANIFAKLECFNPAGSSKDRVALNMLEEAEKRGELKPGGTIIEPTSGNTGIGLAAFCAAKGYKAIFTMPETMSVERRKLLAAYGAEIVLTPAAEGMKGSIEKAEEIYKNTVNSFIPSQFDNPDNPSAHFKATGPEIWNDLDGKIDVFIAGIGTGGTVSGTGAYLKKMNPDIEIIGYEPEDSPLITKGVSGGHKLQGIGANFIPKNFDSTIVDRVVTVTTDEAYSACKMIARKEGILVGITSGGAVSIAIKLSRLEEYKGKNIVALLPDSGERYMSVGMFD